MTGDLAMQRLTAAAVLLVAAIAAAVSYVHIEHLAVTHGQTMLAAVLLPVSIDGTVAAASLVMLRAARAGLGTPWLARVMLGLSVVATLAANVAYGARYGLTGSLLSGWPRSRSSDRRRWPSAWCAAPGRTRPALRAERARGQGGRAVRRRHRSRAGARHPSHQVRAEGRPGQGQPGTGVPARAHPYPVSPRPGLLLGSCPRPGLSPK